MQDFFQERASFNDPEHTWVQLKVHSWIINSVKQVAILISIENIWHTFCHKLNVTACVHLAATREPTRELYISQDTYTVALVGSQKYTVTTSLWEFSITVLQS